MIFKKFVEIVGPGKSGKSTYANLAVALVGKTIPIQLISKT